MCLSEDEIDVDQTRRAACPHKSTIIEKVSEMPTVLNLHSDALAPATFLMPKKFVRLSPGSGHDQQSSK